MRNPQPRLQSPPSAWETPRQQAKQMRQRPTGAENRLWQAVRRNAVLGLKFRRQHAIGAFIVDFYCVKPGLVIEVDGPIHTGQREADEERQAYLESCGLTVLRFSNNEVLKDLPAVRRRIKDAAQSISLRTSHAPSPRKERRLGER